MLLARRSSLGLFLAAAVAAVIATQPACFTQGGCNSRAQNLQVTPAESCLQPSADVCDAQTGWLRVHNGCADPLVVDYSGVDGGTLNPDGTHTDSVTVAPGASEQLNIHAFDDGRGDIHVPAKLGATAIVISYQVVAD